MSVSLTKGQKISLSKEKEGLKNIMVGLGWDAAVRKKGLFGILSSSTPDIDCDATAFLLKNDKITDKQDVVYFGNLSHYTNAVIHQGDNLTGDGDGDDEQIFISLKTLPEEYNKIVLVVNIYEAAKRNQHFGMIQNAFIRIVDTDSKTELCKFNLTDNYSGMTAMVFGEVYRHGNEWKFNAIGNGTKDTSISQLMQRFR